MKHSLRTQWAKALACAVVLGGVAIPAASAFTLIELLVVNANPAMGGTPTTAPAGPSSVTPEQKGPQPIGLLLPAVQKVRIDAPPCPAGQVPMANGKGCQAAGLAAPAGTR